MVHISESNSPVRLFSARLHHLVVFLRDDAALLVVHLRLFAIGRVNFEAKQELPYPVTRAMCSAEHLRSSCFCARQRVQMCALARTFQRSQVSTNGNY